MQENPITKEPGKVPGSFLAGTILQFLLGVLWGVLAVVFYTKMSGAVKAGDIAAFEVNRKRWKTSLFVGIVVNIVILIIYAAFVGSGNA